MSSQEEGDYMDMSGSVFSNFSSHVVQMKTHHYYEILILFMLYIYRIFFGFCIC